MPQTPHVERHFTAGETVRDIVIGMSDGLTVPFALAAGLTGAIDHVAIIVTAGLAEIAAGSIAMGLGGYLAAKSDAEHYAKEREREKREVKEIPEEEMREVAEVFHSYGLTVKESTPIVEALAKHPQKWVDFMMRFELGLEKPDPKRAFISAFTIAFAYIAGGLIPLAPYIFAAYLKPMDVENGAAILSRGDPARAVGVWFYQRTLHRHASDAQRSANRFDWQRGRGRGVSDRAGDFVMPIELA